MKPEATLHRAVADFLRAALPDDVVWSTLDHARHGARYGAQLKARGVSRGLPDILLLVPQNSWQPPLGGAGTVGLVADRMGFDATLIELNPEYATIAERRLQTDGGMFANVSAA